MAYTNQTLVGNQLKRSLTSDEIAILPLLIAAVTNWINLKTSSSFDVSVSQTRKYQGGKQFIDISPCTAVSLVQFVDTYGTAQYSYQTWEYVLHPLNTTVKNQIELRGYTEFAEQDYPNGKFPSGADTLQVTANFSEYDPTNLGAGVPADIQMAATRLCAGMLNDAQTNGIIREELEGHLVQTNFDTIGINDPFVQSAIALHRELLVD